MGISYNLSKYILFKNNQIVFEVVYLNLLTLTARCRLDEVLLEICVYPSNFHAFYGTELNL